MRFPPDSERVYTGFPGEQELHKTNPPPLAGLTKAQENQILTQPFLCSHSLDIFAQFAKCPDCILGVVVVPRYVIVLQEREQPVAILEESLLIAESDLRRECPF